MSIRISQMTFDCRDALSQSVFWAELLGFAEDPNDPNVVGDEECMIVSSDGAQTLLFIEVPESKQVKNRVHLDLRPLGSVTRDEELERVLGLGATTVADHRKADGSGWVVLTDPEGNEFCLERSDAERATPTTVA